MTVMLKNHHFFEPDMKLPLTGSVLFHLIIVIVAVFGLPYIKPKLPVIEPSITVDLVEIEPEKPSQKKQPQKKTQKTKVEPVKRSPPQQLKKEPPKPVLPQLVAKKPPRPVAPKPPEPVAEIKAPLKPKKPPPKPVHKVKEAAPQKDEFKSLLRNLMPTKDAAAQSDTPRKGSPSSLLTRFSPKMSTGEMRALKNQLDRCWSVMAGARYAEELIVDLKLFVNPDRSVRDVQIVNRLRYSADSYFRAAADSARRAVFRCSPLDLPPNKYDLWNEIDVRFDPGKML